MRFTLRKLSVSLHVNVMVCTSSMSSGFRMKSESRSRTIVGSRHTMVHVGFGWPANAAMIAAARYMPKKNSKMPISTSVPSSDDSTGHFDASAGATTH